MSSINHENVNEVIPISRSLSEPSQDEHGKHIILPKAFIGDPRSMRKRYLDSEELISRLMTTRQMSNYFSDIN